MTYKCTSSPPPDTIHQMKSSVANVLLRKMTEDNALCALNIFVIHRGNLSTSLLNDFETSRRHVYFQQYTVFCNYVYLSFFPPLLYLLSVGFGFMGSRESGMLFSCLLLYKMQKYVRTYKIREHNFNSIQTYYSNNIVLFVCFGIFNSLSWMYDGYLRYLSLLTCLLQIHR